MKKRRALAGDRFEVASAGAESERLQVFRRVRDQISARIRSRIASLRS